MSDSDVSGLFTTDVHHPIYLILCCERISAHAYPCHFNRFGDRYRALQVTCQWKEGIGKDLVCRCGLLIRLCSALIRFGAAVN